MDIVPLQLPMKFCKDIMMVFGELSLRMLRHMVAKAICSRCNDDMENHDHVFLDKKATIGEVLCNHLGRVQLCYATKIGFREVLTTKLWSMYIGVATAWNSTH
ncbi:hypothetical protein VNO78_27097 [Psophocarpus tetragonolobus]|uniref:Uncharacterized protein n=1 Tax=Psophocarpus tetragonolobus TaxID=3891 RepID=A0AAN9XAQ9_PSOTE